MPSAPCRRAIALSPALETSPDAVILMDPSGTIHFANPAVSTVFGYTPEEVVGKGVTALQPVQLRGYFVGAVQRFLRSGMKRLNWRAVETLGLRCGAEIPIEVSFSAMNWWRTWFCAFIRDITERKRAERELRENKEQFRVARDIQQRLFPKAAPNLTGFEIGGASIRPKPPAATTSITSPCSMAASASSLVMLLATG